MSEFTNKLEPFLTTLLSATQGVAKPVRAQLLLIINHVVNQEPEAMRQLGEHAGRKVLFESPLGNWPLVITPAGLFEEIQSSNIDHKISGEASLAEDEFDLRFKVKASDPMGLIANLMKGKRPPVDVEGDTELAAVFAWLGENLRWDYAEDLSRVVGDVPAHMVLEQVQGAVELFRGVISSVAQQFKRPK